MHKRDILTFLLILTARFIRIRLSLHDLISIVSWISLLYVEYLILVCRFLFCLDFGEISENQHKGMPGSIQL